MRIGKLALSTADEKVNNLRFANEIFGGGSSGNLFQTLRTGKGDTYGGYSSISTSVRANTTLKSLEIIKNMVSNYA